MEDSGLAQLFSLRHDFPTEWHNFVTGEGNLALNIKRDYFPYSVQGKTLTIREVTIYGIVDHDLRPGSLSGLNMNDLTAALNTKGEIEL